MQRVDRQSVNLRPEMTISTKVHVEFDRGVKMGKGKKGKGTVHYSKYRIVWESISRTPIDKC